MINQELIPYLRAAFERKLRLVPLGMGGGAPQVHKGMKQEEVLATTFEEAQEKWLYGDACAYGVICGKGLLAIDVDLDVPGTQSRFDQHNFPPTYKVTTPSGGFHLYYAVPPDEEFVNDMGKIFGHGIEVKGDNGRITGAGSITKKGVYVAAEPATQPIAFAPDWLIEKTRVKRIESVERGQPQYEKAMQYIHFAPKAIEGAGGDMQTFKVAQTLIRHNLDRSAVEVLMRIYNKEKCEPMWDEVDLMTKIDSAFNSSDYAPSIDFNDTFQPPIIQLEKKEKRFITFNELQHLPPPNYLLPGRLVKGEISFLIGNMMAGKSLVLADWVISLALQGKRVLCLIGEGYHGFNMRVNAWKKQYKLKAFPDSLVVFPNKEFPNMKNPQKLIEMGVFQDQFDLITVDTFERFIGSGSDLNSAQDMGAVIETLTSLATNTGAAILCAHHLPREAERIKGSTTLDGTAHIILLIKKVDGVKPYIHITQQKNKDGTMTEEWKYNFTPVSFQWYDPEQEQDAEYKGVIAESNRWSNDPNTNPHPDPEIIQKNMGWERRRKIENKNYVAVRETAITILEGTNKAIGINQLTKQVYEANPIVIEKQIKDWLKDMMIEKGDDELTKYYASGEGETLSFINPEALKIE